MLVGQKGSRERRSLDCKVDEGEMTSGSSIREKQGEGRRLM